MSGTLTERVVHPFAPIYDENSRILILGSLPSVLSRKNDFYYGNPRNRFWPLLAALTEEAPPQDNAEKRALLLRHHIALWDVIASCEIRGSSDSSIRNAKPNDIASLLRMSAIETIYANGGRAASLYTSLCRESTLRDIVPLPSTSPANAAYTLPKLIEAWGCVRDSLR